MGFKYVSMILFLKLDGNIYKLGFSSLKMVKEERRGVLLFLFSFMFVILSVSFVSADCASPELTIIKLYSANNSHAALWNYFGDGITSEVLIPADNQTVDMNGAVTGSLQVRPYNCPSGYVLTGITQTCGADYCYSDDMKCTKVVTQTTAYVTSICSISGPLNRNCTTPLLWLKSTNNSHVSTTNANGYNIPVCFPDGCSITTSTCSGSVLASLSSNTNAHISSDDNYPVKICCGGGVSAPMGDTYWTDMSGAYIGRADLNDEVKMNVESSGINLNTEINYTVYQKDGSGIWIFRWDKKIAKITGKDSAAWGADREGIFYFTVKLPDGTTLSSENEPHGLLNVTSPENNFFPVVIMDEPIAESQHLVNSEVDFKQSSYDIDDALKAIWDFNDGNITTLLNCNNGENCNTSHKYSFNGVKTVRLTAQEMRSSRNQKNSTARRVYVYSEGINAFAVISKPDPANINLPVIGNVEFDAHQSYVANCTNCSTFDVCPICPVVPASRCYNVTGIVSGVPKKVQCFNYLVEDIALSGAGKYNMWFDWAFDEPPNVKYGNWLQNYTSVVEFTRAFIRPEEHEISLRVGFESHSS